MSASTVSITANTATRRRTLVVADKKLNVESLPNEPEANGDVTKSELFAEKLTGAYSKELNRDSIRDEEATERTPRDLFQLKKTGLGASGFSARKGRKVVAKTEKPWWLTAVSIFTKNFVLLLALAGLVQLIRKLALQSASNYSPDSRLGYTDLEARISEVESFLKTTTKMIQIQVETVDKKMEKEIGNLQKEMDKQIKDQVIVLRDELSKLAASTAVLDKSIGELKAEDWLSKRDIDKFYEGLRNHNNGGVIEAVTLNDIMAQAREIVEKEIEKHAADGLGRVDYALASSGALVVKHSEPYVIEKRRNLFTKYAQIGVHPDSVKMLQPSFGEPGHCFPLKGNHGFVHIKLRTPIIPEAITLEHVSKAVAYDRSSAPKDCVVYGWLQGKDTGRAPDKENMHLLAEFSYDLDKTNAQTHQVMKSGATNTIDTVMFEILSNHGNPSFTCIYRLRVHGHEPDAVPVLLSQP